MSTPKSIHNAVEEYLALRRALGFKLRQESWWLPSFASYLEARGTEVITSKLALRWAQQPVDVDPRWWAKRLSAVRCFARHRQAFDPRTEVPSPDLIACRRQRRTPHIYTEDEICALMQQASRLSHPLLSVTYRTLIGLLAVTGMRVGEAIALDDRDVDWLRARVTVRGAKFGKSRHVPVHEETLGVLKAYARVRNQRRPSGSSPSLFLSRAGSRLIYNTVAHAFAQFVRLAGIAHRAGRPPRLHDLRHSFAVATVRDWYRLDVDVEARLPALSTYLGHVGPTTTYWYLTATPELLALASKRAEQAWGVPS